MVVLIAQLELVLVEQPASLKGKRHVVKSVIERLRQRVGISVAEVGHNDLWQRCLLGITSVSSTRKVLEHVADTIEQMLESDPRIEITNAWFDYQSFGDEAPPRAWSPDEVDDVGSQQEDDQP